MRCACWPAALLRACPLLGVSWACVGLKEGDRVRETSGMLRTSRHLLPSAVHRPPHTLLQISTGLDSATTHALVASLRAASQHQRLTQLVALLQPPPETVALFDDVLVGGSFGAGCAACCSGAALGKLSPPSHLPAPTAARSC